MGTKGETIAFLQGTVSDGVSEWANHGQHFYSHNRSALWQKECDSQVCSHSDQMCTSLDAWSDSWSSVTGERAAVRGTCTSSVRMHQCMMREHRQRHPSLFDLRRNLDGVIRQISNRCQVILSMDANGEVCTTLLRIGSADNRIRDRRQRWTQNGHELLELMRSNRLVASSTHGEANRQCWT